MKSLQKESAGKSMLVVLPVTVISAVLLLRTGQNAKIRGDAAIAMISVGALAVGYLILLCEQSRKRRRYDFRGIC